MDIIAARPLTPAQAVLSSSPYGPSFIFYDNLFRGLDALVNKQAVVFDTKGNKITWTSEDASKRLILEWVIIANGINAWFTFEDDRSFYASHSEPVVNGPGDRWSEAVSSTGMACNTWEFGQSSQIAGRVKDMVARIDYTLSKF